MKISYLQQLIRTGFKIKSSHCKIQMKGNSHKILAKLDETMQKEKQLPFTPGSKKW
jgi:hypothetical protein